MIAGEPTYLTDVQWLTLMKIVSDDEPINLTMPAREGDDAKIIRENKRWQVHADGSADWEVLEI